MPALFEREDALAAIELIVAKARSGRPGALFMVGEPGLGKTTLLARARAAAAGFEIRTARCAEVEAWLPFGLLERLFGDRGRPAAGASRESNEARVACYASIGSWLRERAAVPLLLAIDDLHWADLDSLELLSVLLRRLGELPVAVVATLRPWPPMAAEQAQLLANDGVGVLERLEPLSGRASADLLSGHPGRPMPRDHVQRACQACAGNPLLLDEVARAWGRGEDLLKGTDGALSKRILLPRFAGAGRSAFRWASAASVLGTVFRPGVVVSLSGQGDAEAAQAIQALTAAGLLRSGEDGTAEFAHPLFRQALYEDLAAPLRQELHAIAFKVLRANGAEAAAVANHALHAELYGDPDAISTLVLAGHVALAAGAIATATEHLQSALRLADASPPAGLLRELAQAYLWAGRVDLAERNILRLLDRDGLPGPERVASLRLLAQVLLASARHADAQRRLNEASEQAERFDIELAADTLLDAAFVTSLFEGTRPARATIRRAIGLLARSKVTGRAMAAASNADAYLAFQEGDLSRLDEFAANTRAEAASPDRHPLLPAWDSGFGYAAAARATERFEDSEALLTALMDAAAARGAAFTYQIMAVGHADTLWRLGRLDEARRLLDGAAEMSDLAPLLVPFTSIGLANACHELGADEESAAWASRVEGFMAPGGESPYLRLWLCLFECRNQLRAGKARHAAVAAEQAAAVAEQSGFLEPCIVPWHGAAIEAHVAAGHLDRAAALVERLAEICVPLPCRAPRAVAAAGRAAIAWRQGRPDEAQDLYQTALAHNAAVPMPLAEAETLIAYARFLRRAGRSKQARGVLHRALEVLEPTGARRLQTIASEELAAVGGRRRRSGQPTALTAQEQRVTRLAVQGLTNVEIGRHLLISPKTVDHHLAHVYAKLGLHSRHELIRAWRDQTSGIPPMAELLSWPRRRERPGRARRRLGSGPLPARQSRCRSGAVCS